MGLFDRFKKKEDKSIVPATEERLENFPEMLTAKLLFFERPNLDADKILGELKLHFSSVDNPRNDKAFLYFFPDIQIQLQDSSIPAQCAIFLPNEDDSKPVIADDAFQQNWHWNEASDSAKSCKYEVLVSDFMTRTLDYKTRFNLFAYFLSAVTKATCPQVAYSLTSQKLVRPADVIDSMASKENRYLESFINVRLYNINNGDSGELLMDTVGLHVLGLPDVQIRFTNLNEGEIAGLLWNYAYYIFEQGNVIENGNTLVGLEPNSKWKCERQLSLATPERFVINVQPV
ncbi:DUF4261 domain-containing protein [Phnomibacter sp. MR]|uniref:DUF4261 domain-containing protein n=1 Tax=Phnomibacter sp. MR TaxID=3042318 RepID=UPI003A802004